MLMEALKFILMGSLVKLTIFTSFKMLLFLSLGWCFQTNGKLSIRQNTLLVSILCSGNMRLVICYYSLF